MYGRQVMQAFIAWNSVTMDAFKYLVVLVFEASNLGFSNMKKNIKRAIFE